MDARVLLLVAAALLMAPAQAWFGPSPWPGGRGGFGRHGLGGWDPLARAPRQALPECLNQARPLERAAFAVADAAGGGSEITAELPQVGRPLVRLLRPGLLEVAAERAVPRHCAVYGAADRVVRQFRVPPGLAAGDITYDYDPASGRLAVRVPREPSPPAHCLNALEPLAELAPELRRLEGGWAEITAAVRGVHPRDARVSVVAPGVLELVAARRVPRECEAWRRGPDAVRRRWEVSRALAQSQVQATLRDGLLRIVLPPGSLPAASEPAPQQPAPEAAPAPPARPQASLEELRAQLERVAAEYAVRLASEQQGGKAAPDAGLRDSLTDPTGAPRWFHIPLEGDAEASAAAVTPVCEERVDLDQRPPVAPFEACW